MARLTIFLPDDLLGEIDELATLEQRSRSSVIREASARYVATAHAGEATERRKSAVDRTIALFEELAKAPALDERPSLEILRDARGMLESGRR